MRPSLLFELRVFMVLTPAMHILVRALGLDRRFPGKLVSCIGQLPAGDIGWNIADYAAL